MKIRIGNDFKTKWAITWMGEPEGFFRRYRHFAFF